MANAAKFLLLTVVWAVCTKVALSCMCMPEHPQTHFCRSDFVFRGKVLSKTTNYGGPDGTMPISIKYSIKPSPIYRNQGSTITLRQGQAVNVTTAGYESTCGVTDMEIGETYLVTAKQMDESVIASLCSWNVPFADITPMQRKMLKRDYKETCSQEGTASCEARMHCGAPTIADCGAFQGCTFNEMDDCYVQTLYCGRNADGECAWSNWRNQFNARYTACVEAANPEP